MSASGKEPRPDGPSKCFNGQNIWHFGWFKNRSTMVDPFQGHQILELAPFVDFEKTNGYQVVLITIFDMHIVYNRAKGFNAETSEHQDKVTIVKEENEINSALLAVLDMGNPTFTVPNLLGSGRDLVVELCESVVGEWEADYYTISIGLDSSMCSKRFSTSSPTYWPTYHPTYSPTSTPTTWAPTYHPTTDAPTASPTPFLPEIVLVPPQQPMSMELGGEDFVIPQDVTLSTEVSKKPDGSDRPMLLQPSSGPVDSPMALHGQTGTDGGAAISSLEKSNDLKTRVAILFASFLAVFASCCACACLRWKQRRLDEKKRNLRVLQYNASNQVKVYMQDPV